MAAGRPIIASVDQGTEVALMVADADGGLAVPPDDPDAFIAAVEYLAGDVKLRTRMGANARRWAEKCHSARVTAVSYLDLVGRLSRP